MCAVPGRPGPILSQSSLSLLPNVELVCGLVRYWHWHSSEVMASILNFTNSGLFSGLAWALLQHTVLLPRRDLLAACYGPIMCIRLSCQNFHVCSEAFARLDSLSP